MKTDLSPPSAAVHIAELTFRYGDRRAVDGLNLEIATGEIFVLLGPNGGGKTTLFRLLSTLIPLQTGSVSMLGHDLRTQAAAIRLRPKLGANVQPHSTRLQSWCKAG